MTAPPAADSLSTALYQYELPDELIAQSPVEPRDRARLLVLERASSNLGHRVFGDLPDLLSPGDLVVANRSRVLPARFRARRPGGGQAEILLLRRIGLGRWEALVRPGRRIPPGIRLDVTEGLWLTVQSRTETGGRIIQAHTSSGDPDQALSAHGSIPLPPYIHDWRGDAERYQTVYADDPGSVAAPTAGLHFTRDLVERLPDRGIGWEMLTLHVGLDTFRPVKTESLADHRMHSEYAAVPARLGKRILEVRKRGGRIVAVGTSTVRALESAERVGRLAADWAGFTDLFIYPGYRFRVTDALVTNFHLPRSTLLALVSAFAGRDRTLTAYREAICQRYRFYSLGDAMLIV